MKKLIHRFICWYLRRCGGAFHSYPYGRGCYVVLMDEHRYHDYRFLDDNSYDDEDRD